MYRSCRPRSICVPALPSRSHLYSLDGARRGGPAPLVPGAPGEGLPPWQIRHMLGRDTGKVDIWQVQGSSRGLQPIWHQLSDEARGKTACERGVGISRYIRSPRYIHLRCYRSCGGHSDLADHVRTLTSQCINSLSCFHSGSDFVSACPLFPEHNSLPDQGPELFQIAE